MYNFHQQDTSENICFTWGVGFLFSPPRFYHFWSRTVLCEMTGSNSSRCVRSLMCNRVGWFLLILIAHPSAIDYLLSLVHKASQDKNFEGQRSNFKATGIWVRLSANNLRISQNFEKLKNPKKSLFKCTRLAKIRIWDKFFGFVTKLT